MILKYKQIVFRLWHDKQSWHEIISVEISCKQKHSNFGIIRSSEFWWRYERYGRKILVGCVSKDENIYDFDNLQNKTYYKKSTEINIEKLPQTSSSIVLHIKRAYLQTYIWVHGPFMINLEIDPLQYGYEIDEDDVMKLCLR